MTAQKKKTYILLIVASTVVLLGVLAGVFMLFVNHWTVELRLLGDDIVYIECGAEADYDDPGCVATVSGTLFGRNGKDVPVTAEGEVNPERLGTYRITYTVKAHRQTAKAERTVIVQDTIAPVIELREDTGLTPLDQPYIEAGFVATDNLDGDITACVKRFTTDDTVYYEVSDSSGNTAKAERRIPYENDAPVITLNGGDMITIPASVEPYADPGFTATDDYDGDLTYQVTMTGRVVPYRVGTYELNYTATDRAGLSTTVTRTVVVTPVTPPETVTPEGNVIYLTFDDGPSENTERLLDILDAYGVKATWFVTASREQYVPMIGEIARRGHTVAVHTATHDYESIYASEEAFFDDFLRIWQIIREQTGQSTALCRFPGGSSNTVSSFNPGIMTRLAGLLTECGISYFDWNVSSGDTSSVATRATVIENLKEQIPQYRASVVLQHDTRSFSVDAVEEVIVWGLENGYRFLPLDATSPKAHHPISN